MERKTKTIGDATKRAEAERTFRPSSDALDQEFQGDVASAIGNRFLAQFDDEARVRIERAIHDLFQMSEPVRFRRYACPLLLQSKLPRRKPFASAIACSAFGSWSAVVPH
jgi:hypothetical protein